MKIDKITITGPDNQTNIQDLKRLSIKYPFVEWGILFSKNKEGEQRYPTKDWIFDAIKGDMQLSAHFCGWWVRQVLESHKSYCG